MNVSSFLSNSQYFNSRLQETLNSVRDIRRQLVGEVPADKCGGDKPEPNNIVDEIEFIVETRDSLQAQIDSEISQIVDALGDRHHPGRDADIESKTR